MHDKDSTTQSDSITSAIVSPEWLLADGALATGYAASTPFRHLVFDEFLQPSFCKRLVSTFPPFDAQLSMNESGEPGAKCTHENLPALGGPWAEVDRLIQSQKFLHWLGTITGIPQLLYDPYYFGGGTHENRHGQDLDPHVDFNRHPITGWHRRLNLIVYLNENWDPAWGGAIELHKDPRLPADLNTVRRVQPTLNRAVLFETTHWSWHGFERINLPLGPEDPRSRKSLALYFYSKDRPPEEQVAPHSTIYVERQLPSHIQPGHVLTDGDHAEIIRLLARRDQHLQRLYGYISELNQQLEDSRKGLPIVAYRRLRALAGRALRKLRNERQTNTVA